MKLIIFIISIFILASCSSFSKISSETKIGSEDYHVKIYNSKANFKSLTFGDFEFAMNKRQFRKLNATKPKFNDILFYAKTNDPAYEYYILFNAKKSRLKNNFIIRDTTIANSTFTLAISKNAPLADMDYIIHHISAEKQ